MKKNLTLGIIGWLMATLGGYKAIAQETTTVTTTPDGKKQSREIIIRQKGDKDTKLTVEISGDKVLINGKPLAEFKEDGVTVNGRKMIIRDGDKYTFDVNGQQMDLSKNLEELGNMRLEELGKMKGLNLNWDNGDMSFGEGKGYTYLGVNTEKADDGVKITSVSKESPAEKAGLQANDIIYKIDDTKIETTDGLSETIRAKKDGGKVKVYFMRDGKKKEEKATLATQKNMGFKSFSYSMPDGSMKSFSMPKTPRMPNMPRVYNFNDGDNSDGDFSNSFPRHQKLGLKIQDLEEGSGVKVLEVESASAAATAGLMKDDVITEIGGVKVINTDEAREQLQENAEKNAYNIKAKRNGTEMEFNIKIPKKLKTANL